MTTVYKSKQGRGAAGPIVAQAMLSAEKRWHRVEVRGNSQVPQGHGRVMQCVGVAELGVATARLGRVLRGGVMARRCSAMAQYRRAACRNGMARRITAQHNQLPLT